MSLEGLLANHGIQVGFQVDFLPKIDERLQCVHCSTEVEPAKVPCKAWRQIAKVLHTVEAGGPWSSVLFFIFSEMITVPFCQLGQ